MSSMETLALLCAGSTRYHEGLGCGAASGQLSRSEIAGLLSGLSNNAMNLALAKYAGDLSSERKLWSCVYLHAVDMALAESWKIQRGRPTVANMAYLAVFEVVRPNRCNKCKGTGFVRIKQCGCCAGSGYKLISGNAIAEAIFIDKSNYSRTWESRYVGVLNYVQAIDAEVNRAVRVADRECA